MRPQATFADTVLIAAMAPDYPDISRRAGSEALCSEWDVDEESEDDQWPAYTASLTKSLRTASTKRAGSPAVQAGQKRSRSSPRPSWSMESSSLPAAPQALISDQLSTYGAAQSTDQPMAITAESNPKISAALRRPLGKYSGRRERTRLYLPIALETMSGGSIMIDASADSGSDENIMSLSAAQKLGLDIARLPGALQTFTLANGRRVSSIGSFEARYAFDRASAAGVQASALCMFHVLQTLATDVIMGLTFLEETKTLTEHRDRLVERAVEMPQALRVNSVGRPRKQLSCCLHKHIACASVDSGSDLDLINPEFVRSRAMHIVPSEEELMFADGSLARTSGAVVAPFSIVEVDREDVRGVVRRSNVVDIEFFVLESLSADVLVGHDTIREFDVFNAYDDCLVPSLGRIGESDINVVIHLRSAQQSVSKVLRGRKCRSGANDEDDGVNIDDARENARYSGELQRAGGRKGSPSHAEAVRLETARHAAYTHARAHGDGVFQCKRFKCNAPAFATQDLLK